MLHKEANPRRKHGKALEMGICDTGRCIAALFGNMLGYAWNVTHREEPIPEVPMEQIQNTNISEVPGDDNRFWTVAVFGVDSREESLEKARGGNMEMVLNINLETGEIRMVSVYRDTYVKIDEKNKYDKINQAYFEGGGSGHLGAERKYGFKYRRLRFLQLEGRGRCG